MFSLQAEANGIDEIVTGVHDECRGMMPVAQNLCESAYKSVSKKENAWDSDKDIARMIEVACKPPEGVDASVAESCQKAMTYKVGDDFSCDKVTLLDTAISSNIRAVRKACNAGSNAVRKLNFDGAKGYDEARDEADKALADACPKTNHYLHQDCLDQGHVVFDYKTTACGKAPFHIDVLRDGFSLASHGIRSCFPDTYRVPGYSVKIEATKYVAEGRVGKIERADGTTFTPTFSPSQAGHQPVCNEIFLHKDWVECRYGHDYVGKATVLRDGEKQSDENQGPANGTDAR